MATDCEHQQVGDDNDVADLEFLGVVENGAVEIDFPSRNYPCEHCPRMMVEDVDEMVVGAAAFAVVDDAHVEASSCVAASHERDLLAA